MLKKLFFAAGMVAVFLLVVSIDSFAGLTFFSDDVLYDDGNDKYWFRDLRVANDKSYAEQLLIIDALNDRREYRGPWGKWHMADEDEISGLWSYFGGQDNANLADYFIPNITYDPGHFYIWGRYDKEGGSGKHYHCGMLFFEGEFEDYGDPGDQAYTDDAVAWESAWITASPANDTDGDNIADPFDQCPATPAGAAVDLNGCLFGDYDRDGDVDASDLSKLSLNFGLEDLDIWYEDADDDGFGNGEIPLIVAPGEEPPSGYVASHTDCDDTESDIHPGADDIPYNGVDEDCSGSDRTGIYNYRRRVTVSAPGSELTDVELLIEIDTQTLIRNSKLQANCDDIRIMDADGTTVFDYWIEGGCGTQSTQIWINLPTIPAEGATLFLYYGDPEADTEELPWPGNFLLMSTVDCNSGWFPTTHTISHYRFISGSRRFGEMGGENFHRHDVSVYSSLNIEYETAAANTTSPADPQKSSHSHHIDTVSNSTSSLPPYLDIILCQSQKVDIPADSIGLFSGPFPAGWERFTPMDNRFPRIAPSYGGIGGQQTHDHTVSGYLKENVRTADVQSGTDLTAADDNHNHYISAATADASNIPPCIDMVYATNSTPSTAAPGAIMGADTLPPMGWVRFSILDNRFPRGAAAFSDQPFGAGTHNHSFSANSNSSTFTQSAASGNDISVASRHHIHQVSTTTASSNHLPPYYGVIFIQKMDGTADGAISITIGGENEG